MLWTAVLVLVALWVLAQATSYTVGGFIHILLIAAVVVAIFRVIQSRKLLK
jgi:hypothetical protein